MDYTPKSTEQPSAAPSYALIDDVTHRPPNKRGAQILSNHRGHKMKVPYPPKDNCKKCHGRGFVGTDSASGEILICRKCYPHSN